MEQSRLLEEYKDAIALYQARLEQFNFLDPNDRDAIDAFIYEIKAAEIMYKSLYKKTKELYAQGGLHSCQHTA